jgi:hypothetical protein
MGYLLHLEKEDIGKEMSKVDNAGDVVDADVVTEPEQLSLFD